MLKYVNDANKKYFPNGDIVIDMRLSSRFDHQYLWFNLKFIAVQNQVKEE
jgi:hypothetical protein